MKQYVKDVISSNPERAGRQDNKGAAGHQEIEESKEPAASKMMKKEDKSP